MDNFNKLEKICKLVRYDILTSTTAAGSGHPTSSLSAVELLVTLFFGAPSNGAGGFLNQNDHFILSKGHAAPLLYSLYHAAGVISYEDLMKLRTFDSPLEGHPTPRFRFVDVATGSLGQGLSVGVGMALGIKLKVNREPRVYVLLGDSEFSEGQIYEALQLASFYKLNNLIGILDVNRLGQRGETMLGWDVKKYAKRVEAFGWKTIVVDDGHDIEKVYKAFNQIQSKPFDSAQGEQKPIMVIARTIKGKGVSFLENQDGWHGKPVPKEKLEEALKELGKVDFNLRGDDLDFLSRSFEERVIRDFERDKKDKSLTVYKIGGMVATREAYGDALVALGQTNPNIVVLDAEVSNSTFSEKFQKAHPERFFEMYIGEQNMISAALGISKIGFIPFASTFAAFLTRAFDQIRMAQYSKPNLKLCGSHAGVSIGQDGPSQMGLEDLAMMRSISESVVFYPCDATSTVKLVEIMLNNQGIFYLRTNRSKTPVIYDEKEKFKVGGSKVLRQSLEDKAVVFAAGITLHEALKAYGKLKKKGIKIAVVDLYSIKPLDHSVIKQFSHLPIIVVEDHYPYGGLGEAVAGTILNFVHLCVRKIPRSGKPEELLRYEEIDAQAIIKAVKSLI